LIRGNVRICAFILAGLSAATLAAELPRPGYVLIVHPSSRAARVDRKFLADVFLRRATRWPDDKPIYPVDLGPAAPARVRFSQEILSRSVASVRSYWQQRIFSGQGLPPPEFPDEHGVVSYVATHPGAIGYVPLGTPMNGAAILEVN
jgi:ABC-type phosphate transport system substrate-binding protein